MYPFCPWFIGRCLVASRTFIRLFDGWWVRPPCVNEIFAPSSMKLLTSEHSPPFNSFGARLIVHGRQGPEDQKIPYSTWGSNPRPLDAAVVWVNNLCECVS